MKPLHKRLIGEALEAAEFSYKPAWQNGLVSFEDKCGAFACLQDTEDRLILTFRGTDGAKDWLKNLRSYPCFYSEAWVHRGFMASHEIIWPRVYAELQRRGGVKPLLIVGHSYGGALAELSCMFLRDYPAGASLVTFGKPNVFCKPRGAARFRYLQAQISVVHGSDAVARVPHFLFGPDLGQTMLYFSNGNAEIWIPPQTADQMRDFLADDWSWRDGLITDHLLPGYRRRYDKWTKTL